MACLATAFMQPEGQGTAELSAMARNLSLQRLLLQRPLAMHREVAAVVVRLTSMSKRSGCVPQVLSNGLKRIVMRFGRKGQRALDEVVEKKRHAG